MPRKSDLPTLQQRLEALQRQIRAARAGEKKQARADDARRKIIAGALALEHHTKNPDSEFARVLTRLLDEYARPEDRWLFDFLPARDSSLSPAPNAIEAAE